MKENIKGKTTGGQMFSQEEQEFRKEEQKFSREELEFSCEELEMLCQAYFDCRLSRLEEQELALVLLSLPEDFGSPIIREAREALAFETVCAASEKEKAGIVLLPKEKFAGRFQPRLRWLWTAAASLIVLFAVGAWWMSRPTTETEQTLAKVETQEPPETREIEQTGEKVVVEEIMPPIVKEAKQLAVVSEPAFRKPKETAKAVKAEITKDAGNESNAKDESRTEEMEQPEPEQEITPPSPTTSSDFALMSRDIPILISTSQPALAVNSEPALAVNPEPSAPSRYRRATADDLLDLQLLLLDRQVRTIEAVGNYLLDNNEHLVNCLYVSEEIIY